MRNSLIRNRQWEEGGSRINSTLDLATTFWPSACVKLEWLGGYEAAGWKKSVYRTAKDGRHPLWPLKTFVLLVWVLEEITM